jgi:hypothetical protein
MNILNRTIKIISLAVMTAMLFAPTLAQGQRWKDASPVADSQTGVAAQGDNTRGRIAKSTGTSTVGEASATEDGGGNIGMGTPPPTSPLTANGQKTTAERRPFQARIIVTPLGNAFQTQFLAIPAGKRLVIENVSAIARCPEGQRMEINFFSYLDNNGDGVGDVADITFHRIALTDQGTFVGEAIFSANHKVLVFADEQIGTSHFQVGVSARLNGTATGPAQAQVTFSGYVEDLPAVQ